MIFLSFPLEPVLSVNLQRIEIKGILPIVKIWKDDFLAVLRNAVVLSGNIEGNHNIVTVLFNPVICYPGLCVEVHDETCSKHNCHYHLFHNHTSAYFIR